MSAANLAAFTAKAAASGTVAAKLVAQCQDTITTAKDYTARGGADGNTWPQAALACAFAYLTSQQSKYLTQAILYWKTSLNDDQSMGDGLGCTAANASFNWKTWTGGAPVPPNLQTVVHDTGYPIRWYGPFIGLVYDWLYNAPGVDDALRAQTRSCLTAWIDHYTADGYLNDFPGANYNAGFVIAKTIGAIAIGNDGGADGHLWTEILNDVFAKLLVGQGLLGSSGGLADPAGIMVGGDWGSWQYGPLSIAEYAAAARAVEEAGAPQPEMDTWVNSLIVREIHGLVPKADGQFCGNGDFDSENIYEAPSITQADAVLLGPSSDQAAGWAAFVKQQSASNSQLVWNALAEIRNVQPQDFRTQTPIPSLWYLARGTGTMYMRTSWDANAFWSVFMSESAETNHAHYADSNFIFSRAGDHLIVDSSNYGEYGSFETNALSADASTTVGGDYVHSQVTWAKHSLPWARGSEGAVFAARSELTHAFDFNSDTPSDIRYAHREWAFLPEGEIVTIDRVHTGGASLNMYVNFHTNTGGTLKLDGGTRTASGSVGASRVAIHPVLVSGGTPKIAAPPVGSCTLSCNYPCGACTAARFAVDEYALSVPGPWAVAIHVIDGLDASEAQAQVGSMNDDNLDPAPKQNAGVIGAAVYRGTKQNYVVASSAQDGTSGASMSYGVPGESAGRHIVYDAPEAADGTSAVTASAVSGRCLVTITAGAGGGLAGHPLMFQVAAATDACAVTENLDVPVGVAPPGGGPTGSGGGGVGGNTAIGGTGGAGKSSGGCSCTTAGADADGSGPLVCLLAALIVVRRSRSKSKR